MKPTRTHTPRHDGRPACGVRGDTASAPEHVDCLRCRWTKWWAANHDTMPGLLVVWPLISAAPADVPAATGSAFEPCATRIAERMALGWGCHHAEARTESGPALRWLLTHPEVPLRWRFLWDDPQPERERWVD